MNTTTTTVEEGWKNREWHNDCYWHATTDWPRLRHPPMRDARPKLSVCPSHCQNLARAMDAAEAVVAAAIVEVVRKRKTRTYRVRVAWTKRHRRGRLAWPGPPQPQQHRPIPATTRSCLGVEEESEVLTQGAGSTNAAELDGEQQSNTRREVDHEKEQPSKIGPTTPNPCSWPTTPVEAAMGDLPRCSRRRQRGRLFWTAT